MLGVEIKIVLTQFLTKLHFKTKVGTHATQRHVIGCSLVIVFVAFPPAGLAAGASQEDQAKLSSLQQKIDELYRTGKYREAIPIAQQRLQLVEKIAGPDGEETGAACDKLGELYLKNGEYAKAKPLCERGLEVREKTLGPDHPGTAASLDNLAMLYRDMGDYAKAEPLYQRVLKICEKALGQDHPSTAASLNHLAGLYCVMGD